MENNNQNASANAAKVKLFSQSIEKIKKEIAKDVVGQEDIVDNVITAIIAGGNVLLEGVPGVGKTRLVRSLGKTLSLPFSRIQFTPDLMPSDVTGSNVIEKDDSGKMKTTFRKGPIFANLVLADEINRATPKTQSAMLEVMQEHKITVLNETYKMEEPFFVLATENPIEQDGTYPLPEAQMDRFMFKLIMQFPTRGELVDIVNMTQITMDENATAVVDGKTILEMREIAKTVPVIDDVMNYAIHLVSNTHPEIDGASDTAKKYIKNGASPRAAQALITCAKVRALMHGNYNVSYDDIDALAAPVLRHRVKTNFNAVNDGLTVDGVIARLLDENKKIYKRVPTPAHQAAPVAEVAPAPAPVEEAAVEEKTDEKDGKKDKKKDKVKKEKPEKVKKEKAKKGEPLQVVSSTTDENKD